MFPNDVVCECLACKTKWRVGVSPFVIAYHIANRRRNRGRHDIRFYDPLGGNAETGSLQIPENRGR